MEIERKFLIKENEFNYKEYPHKFYEQGYLSVNPVVRVRMEGDAYVLTYKGPGILSHEEYNLPLNKESYEHLLKKADGIIIKKNRYFIPFDKYTIELDEFLGAHEGLIIAEVEFDSEEEANSFTPPSWFGEDVTFDAKYRNSSLSKGV